MHVHTRLSRVARECHNLAVPSGIYNACCHGERISTVRFSQSRVGIRNGKPTTRPARAGALLLVADTAPGHCCPWDCNRSRRHLRARAATEDSTTRCTFG
jgi:hypothetical protein